MSDRLSRLQGFIVFLVFAAIVATVILVPMALFDAFDGGDGSGKKQPAIVEGRVCVEYLDIWAHVEKLECPDD